jgi:hypothetical protein
MRRTKGREYGEEKREEYGRIWGEEYGVGVRIWGIWGREYGVGPSEVADSLEHLCRKGQY